MEDFPKTLAEFEARFSTEQACRDYLIALRWPEGFCCPKCRGTAFWKSQRGLLVCSACQFQASPTAGTIFQDTRKPLMTWFRAMWYVTAMKTGASALGVQRVLGLGSYETAWTWLHKLRRAMVRPGRDRLTGRVEVDETYWGASETGGVSGRKIEKKVLIAVAAQEDGRGIGRIRLGRVNNAGPSALGAFIQATIEPGSTVHTDGWHGYRHLPRKGYVHEVSVLAEHKEPASELLPRVHRVVALLKTWLQGTHQGAVSHTHLDYYLDEFTFRFNRRKSGSRGKLFYRLAQQAMQVEPVPYKKIVHPNGFH
jgi:transposase-like protein/ribosomal protein L37AE/L43A